MYPKIPKFEKTTLKRGEFKRKDDVFRDWIEENSKFEPEIQRYILYVSLACPWSCRNLMFLKLKGLEKLIRVVICKPIKNSTYGWSYMDGNVTKFIHDLYLNTDKDYINKQGGATVPVLWDRKTKTIVNNSDDDINLMINNSFNDFTKNKRNMYPQAIKTELDELNSFIYENVCNGVYKCGFAKTQKAYNVAVKRLFKSLDYLNNRLSYSTYLFSNDFLVDADLRLFVTLIRFDVVYHGLFKCNLKRIKDYSRLYKYMVGLYHVKEVKETVNFEHIKNHYYKTLTNLNPSKIVPLGPIQKFEKK